MKMKMICAMIVSLALMLGVCACAEDARLSVQGTGVISLDPDTATIMLGVRESAQDVGEAQAAVNQKLTAVIEKLKSMGVKDEDIHTDSINIYEDYSYTDDDDGARFYAAENSISVTIGDIENAGEYIDAVFDAGANTFSGINFSASDTVDARKRALELSVQSARDKAEVLAAAAGMKITGITAMSEQDGGVYSNYYAGSSFDGIMEKAAADPGTPVYSEQIQVSATVTIEFTMAPVE